MADNEAFLKENRDNYPLNASGTKLLLLNELLLII